MKQSICGSTGDVGEITVRRMYQGKYWQDVAAKIEKFSQEVMDKSEAANTRCVSSIQC